MKNFFALLFPLVVSATCHAQVVVTQPTQPPGSYEFGLSGGTNGLGWRNDSSGVRDLAQSFTATSDYNLGQIYVQISSGGIPSDVLGAAFTISLYGLASGETAPSGTPLITESGTFGTSLLNSNTYLDFTLPSTFSITSGSSYAFALSFSSSSSTRQIVLAISTDTAYPDGGGELFSSADGVTYAAVGGHADNLNFWLVAAPEPGTFTLAGIGMAGIAWRIIRKSRKTVRTTES